MGSGDVVQSVLSPAGAPASSIHQLWLLLLATTSIVFVIVIAFVAVAVVRSVRRRPSESTPTTSERTLTRSVGVAVALTVATLIVLLVASIWTGRSVESVQASSALSVKITGHQWWWEIEYEDCGPEPARPHRQRDAHPDRIVPSP